MPEKIQPHEGICYVSWDLSRNSICIARGGGRRNKWEACLQKFVLRLDSHLLFEQLSEQQQRPLVRGRDHRQKHYLGCARKRELAYPQKGKRGGEVLPGAQKRPERHRILSRICEFKKIIVSQLSSSKACSTSAGI